MYQGYPPWYPMPPPQFTQLPPGYMDTRDQDPIKLAKRWEKFIKREKKEVKKEENKSKAKTFTFIEAFMLCTIFSLPIGMMVSFLVVSGMKMWVAAMSSALGVK